MLLDISEVLTSILYQAASHVMVPLTVRRQAHLLSLIELFLAILLLPHGLLHGCDHNLVLLGATAHGKAASLLLQRGYRYLLELLLLLLRVASGFDVLGLSLSFHRLLINLLRKHLWLRSGVGWRKTSLR